MPPIDVRVLAQQVRAILADPHAAAPATGDASLDLALAALAKHRRMGRPLVGPHAAGFWYKPFPSVYARD